MSSPCFSLSIQVVKAFGHFLNLRLLPLDIGTVLLHFVGHVAAAGFGLSQVLLGLCDDRSFASQLRRDVLETRIQQTPVHHESFWKKYIKRKKYH